MTKNQNLKIVQGTPFRIRVQTRRYVDEALQPYNLTGATIHLQARKTVDSPKTLIDLYLGHGITLVDGGASGVFIIEMTPEQTSALPRISTLSVPYQCEVDPVGEDVFRALDGQLTISPEVVR